MRDVGTLFVTLDNQNHILHSLSRIIIKIIAKKFSNVSARNFDYVILLVLERLMLIEYDFA